MSNQDVLLVLGDSVQWGQGLRPEQKMAELVAAARGIDHVERYAHSGATVWYAPGASDTAEFPPPRPVDDDLIAQNRWPSSQDKRRAAVGELPFSEPFTWCQLARASEDFAGRSGDVSLVLVDGGINDVNVLNITIPTRSEEKLRARVRSFRGRMAPLLKRIAGEFPRATIVVTGYFRIWSKESDIDEVLPWIEACDRTDPGVAEALVLRASLAAEAGAAGSKRQEFFRRFLRDKLASLSDVFVREMHAVLKAEVDDARGDLPGRHLLFVDPKFQPENSVGAKKAFLYSVPSAEKPDEVWPERHAACAACQKDVQGQCYQACDGIIACAICDHAAMGHPNTKGARRYADAILKALGSPRHRSKSTRRKTRKSKA